MITLAELRRQQNVAAAARIGAIARAAIEQARAAKAEAEHETMKQRRAKLAAAAKERRRLARIAHQQESELEAMRARRAAAIETLRDPNAPPRQRTRAVKFLGLRSEDPIHLDVADKVVPNFVSELAEQVAEKHRIPVTLIYVRSNSPLVVRARQELFWHIRQHRSAPCWTWIAKWFGMDHSTVIHGAKRHEQRMRDAAASCQENSISVHELGRTGGWRLARLFAMRSAELELAS